MESYIKFIEEFNVVSSQPFSYDRTIKRNEILQKMETLTNMIFDINELMNETTVGNVAFSLTMIKNKIINYKLCYNGPTVTDKIFNYILTNTNNKSDYIQEYSRFLITLGVEKGVFNLTYQIKIKNFVESYNCDNNENRNEWVHKTLLSIYKPTSDDLLGCLIGKCVGDSLGFQVEGHGPVVCKKYVEEFVQTVKVPTITRIPGLTFGQYTDDSQLTRELLISIVSNNGIVDGDVYAKRMATLFQPGNYRIVGYGKTCASALEAVWNGENYKKTGCTKGHGNGSAMRSAPIGILYGACQVKDIVQVTKMLSSITHARGRCMTGAAAISLAAKFSAACKNIKFDVNTFSKFVANTGDEQLDSVIKMMPEFLNWKPEQVSDYIIRLGLSDGESQWDGISAGVTQTVLWSLYCFCKNPDSYVNCVSDAIAVGGDVDTTAAIAGSLCGIRNSIDTIPDIWKHQIHDINEWDYNDLCYLVEEVFKTIQGRIYPEFRF